MILTLDLGENTGWAYLGGEGLVTYGTQVFANTRFQGGGMQFLMFSRWLTQMLPFSEVYFEEVKQHAKSVAAGHAYGGFMAILTSWCEANKVPYRGVPVGTIKKHVTGNGGASKDAVKEAVEKHGFNPQDDNSADALALMLYVRSKVIVNIGYPATIHKREPNV